MAKLSTICLNYSESPLCGIYLLLPDHYVLKDDNLGMALSQFTPLYISIDGPIQVLNLGLEVDYLTGNCR